MSALGYGSQMQLTETENELCLYKRYSINYGITIKYIDITTLVESEVIMLAITPPPVITVPIPPSPKPYTENPSPNSNTGVIPSPYSGTVPEGCAVPWRTLTGGWIVITLNPCPYPQGG